MGCNPAVNSTPLPVSSLPLHASRSSYTGAHGSRSTRSGEQVSEAPTVSARLALPERGDHLGHRLAAGAPQAERGHARVLRDGRRAGRALALDCGRGLRIHPGGRQVAEAPACARAQAARSHARAVGPHAAACAAGRAASRQAGCQAPCSIPGRAQPRSAHGAPG